MDWYKDWFGTRYYALLYGHRDEADAEPWVRSILDRWRPPQGARLLDLACGRGRHALHFDHAGMQVTGADLSPESIAEAARRVPRASFRVHDIRSPFPGPPFTYITCLFTSLGYTADEMDDRQVLQAVATSLEPGGRFVLDLLNPAFVVQHLVPLEHRTIEGVQFEVRRWADHQFIHKSITVDDAGTLYHYQERVRMLYPEHVEALAQQCGLVVEDRTDGPVLSPFDRDRSARYVLWTHKPLLA
ncbi:MAG: class I SAM-dependent methyltransferase [Flavobacteriales bacterium]|nr:class I SAM-dependent methyltransferase [Flavobacteriales bacterium]